MTSHDQVLRSRAILQALKANVPDDWDVEQKWVSEYHSAVKKASDALGVNLNEFMVPAGEVRQVIAARSGNGTIHYRNGLWCQRAVLMQKLDALSAYLALLEPGAQNSRYNP